MKASPPSPLCAFASFVSLCESLANILHGEDFAGTEIF